MKLTKRHLAPFAALALWACGSGGGGKGGSGDTPEPLLPPSGLTYDLEVAYFIQGVLIPAASPDWEGTVDTFTVNPPLPGGLTIDSTTGELRGVPNTQSEEQLYTITASGPLGTDETELRLAVVNVPRVAVVASLEESLLSIHTVDPQTGNLSLHRIQATPAGQEGPEEVLLHPGGRFLFVPTTSNWLSTYRIHETSGELVALAPLPLDAGPHHAALGADGQTLHVTCESAGSVQTFAIDSATGALTELARATPAPAMPGAITVDPLGRFAYVVQQANATVRTYLIDQSTGVLTSVSPDTDFPAQTPVHVGMAPDGSWAFVILEDRKLTPAAVDPATGLLQPEHDAQLDTGETPEVVAVHPTGQFVYVTASAQNEVDIYRFDRGLGQMVDAGPIEVAETPRHITFDASGLYAYVCHEGTNEVTAYDVDLSTGTLLRPRGTLVQAAPSSVALITGDDTIRKEPCEVYVLGQESEEVATYTMDPATGDLTQLGPTTPVGGNPRDLRLDPLGRFAFVANAGDRTISVLRFESDGSLSRLSEVPVDYSPRGLAVDPLGRFLYASFRTADKVVSFTIDPETGGLTRLHEAAVGLDPRRISLHPTGRFLFVANYSAGTVSALRVEDGRFVTDQLVSPAPSHPDRIRFSPRGDRAFLGGASADILIPYRINPRSGELAPILPGKGVGNQPLAVDIHENDQWAYAAIADFTGQGWVRFLLMDPIDGDFQGGDVGAVVEAGANPSNLMVAPGGRFLVALNRGSDDLSIFDIDQTTGEPTNRRQRATVLEPWAIEMTYQLD